MLSQTEIKGELQDLFAQAGCDGFLCAQDLGGQTVELNADELVISASVFKVLVALAFFTLAERGELDPTERVRVDPRTSLGAPAGLSIFEDEVETSFRDLVNSMLSVSDMIATDTVPGRSFVARPEGHRSGTPADAASGRLRPIQSGGDANNRARDNGATANDLARHGRAAGGLRTRALSYGKAVAGRTNCACL
jgi:hypothetical protein